MDHIKQIKDKFLNWNTDCKGWIFEDLPDLHDGIYSWIVITLPILDSHNDYVQLFAQIYPCDCCDKITVKISDGGFLHEEFKCMKKEYLFARPLAFLCEISKFDEGMDYYFDVLRCAGRQIGFSWIKGKDETKK